MQKPCPFCGGLAGFVERSSTCTYQYYCDCGARGPTVEKAKYEWHAGTPLDDAMRAWNRRSRHVARMDAATPAAGARAKRRDDSGAPR